MKTCSQCSEIKDINNFLYQRTICKDCGKLERREYYLKLRENPEKVAKQREINRIKSAKNYENRKSYTKEWVANNKEKVAESKRIWSKKKRELDPNYFTSKPKYPPSEFTKMGIRIRQSFRRLLNKVSSSTAFYYTGCSSMEDFIFGLSLKTENKNWIQDGYHIDHIWQVHWFSKFFDENCSNEDIVDELNKIIHNLKNLRPLPASENLGRDDLDFSPLEESDFSIYKPYLNENIKNKLINYFTSKT